MPDQTTEVPEAAIKALQTLDRFSDMHPQSLREGLLLVHDLLTTPLREELADRDEQIASIQKSVDTLEAAFAAAAERAAKAEREREQARVGLDDMWKAFENAVKRADSAERRLEEARDALEEPIHTLASTIGRIHVALQNPRRNPSPLPDVEANVVAMGRLRAALATLQGPGAASTSTPEEGASRDLQQTVDEFNAQPDQREMRDVSALLDAPPAAERQGRFAEKNPTPEQPEEPTCERLRQWVEVEGNVEVTDA